MTAATADIADKPKKKRRTAIEKRVDDATRAAKLAGLSISKIVVDKSGTVEIVVGEPSRATRQFGEGWLNEEDG